MRSLLIFSLAALLLPGFTYADDQGGSGEGRPGKAGSKQTKKEGKVLPLFDGTSLKGWKRTNFGGEGDVFVKDGAIVMEMGSNLTGVTWEDEKVLPKTNYEVTFKAKRADGFDFFCGLTVPIKDSHCSLICGGWGGGVCGISSIDTYDASENATTSYREFKTGKWYDFKLRVTDYAIRAWVDGEEIVDHPVPDHKFSVRIEVDRSKPLGFSCWQTTAAVKAVKLRRLTEAELAKARKREQ